MKKLCDGRGMCHGSSVFAVAQVVAHMACRVSPRAPFRRLALYTVAPRTRHRAHYGAWGAVLTRNGIACACYPSRMRAAVALRYRARRPTPLATSPQPRGRAAAGRARSPHTRQPPPACAFFINMIEQQRAQAYRNELACN